MNIRYLLPNGEEFNFLIIIRLRATIITAYYDLNYDLLLGCFVFCTDIYNIITKKFTVRRFQGNR